MHQGKRAAAAWSRLAWATVVTLDRVEKVLEFRTQLLDLNVIRIGWVGSWACCKCLVVGKNQVTWASFVEED